MGAHAPPLPLGVPLGGGKSASRVGRRRKGRKFRRERRQPRRSWFTSRRNSPRQSCTSCSLLPAAAAAAAAAVLTHTRLTLPPSLGVPPALPLQIYEARVKLMALKKGIGNFHAVERQIDAI